MTLKSGTPSRHQPRESRVFRQLPITIMTTAEDQRTVRVDPNTVDVQVSGAPEILPRLNPRDIRVFVDLAPIEDKSQFRLRVEVHTPFGVILERVIPSEVVGQRLPPPASEP